MASRKARKQRRADDTIPLSRTKPASVPGCTGKAKYESKLRALGVAQAASRKSGDALRTYECPHCKGWHLTKRI